MAPWKGNFCSNGVYKHALSWNRKTFCCTYRIIKPNYQSTPKKKKHWVTKEKKDWIIVSLWTDFQGQCIEWNKLHYELISQMSHKNKRNWYFISSLRNFTLIMFKIIFILTYDSGQVQSPGLEFPPPLPENKNKQFLF